MFVPVSYLLHHIADYFFFTDPATTEIYTLSLHDALPISGGRGRGHVPDSLGQKRPRDRAAASSETTAALDGCECAARSEEHTSELQSQSNLVCRLPLEKKEGQGSLHPPLPDALRRHHPLP